MTTAEPRPGLLRRARRAVLKPILAQVAKAYVAGDTADDARRVARRWAARGLPATLGFWDDERDAPRAIAGEYLAALQGLAPPDYLSIKVTALRYDEGLVDEVAARALAQGVRLHFDAMWPDTVERTRAVIDRVLARFPGLAVGTTLAGRWARSVGDADWVVERRLPVRVVKGQFPDDSATDLRGGFEQVVAALSGRAAHVAVASHDVPLAEACLSRLGEAGTSRELELLHGLPTRASIASAARLGVPVRIYVGYGRAHLPYAVGKVAENPRMILWLARDLLRL